MTGKTRGRRARNAAAKFEIDRAIVARRQSGLVAERKTVRLVRKLRASFDAHPAPATRLSLPPHEANRRRLAEDASVEPMNSSRQERAWAVHDRLDP